MEIAGTLVTGVVLAIATALATAYFTSRFYVHQATTDLRSEYQRRFNEKRWEVYMGFADTVRDLLMSAKRGRVDKDQPKFIERLYDFIGGLWLIGSDDVVRSVLAWRRIAQDEQKAGSTEALLSLVEIMVAMRKDLGDTTTEIQGRDILATFVNEDVLVSLSPRLSPRP
jgi:hypothetical protein